MGTSTNQTPICSTFPSFPVGRRSLGFRNIENMCACCVSVSLWQSGAICIFCFIYFGIGIGIISLVIARYFFAQCSPRRYLWLPTMSIYIKYNACGYWFIPFYWTICVHRMPSKRRTKKEKKIEIKSNISEKRCVAWLACRCHCRWLNVDACRELCDKAFVYSMRRVRTLRWHCTTARNDTHRHTLILWLQTLALLVCHKNNMHHTHTCAREKRKMDESDENERKKWINDRQQQQQRTISLSNRIDFT